MDCVLPQLLGKIYPLKFRTPRSIAQKEMVPMHSTPISMLTYRLTTSLPPIYHGNLYFTAYWRPPGWDGSAMIRLWPRLLRSMKRGGAQDPQLITYTDYFVFEKYMWVPHKKKWSYKLEQEVAESSLLLLPSEIIRWLFVWIEDKKKKTNFHKYMFTIVLTDVLSSTDLIFHIAKYVLV